MPDVTTVWSVAAGDHSAELATFVRHAGALDPAAWNAPVGEGKWTPAQITEHLRLTYDVLVRELEGGGGIRVRTPGWLRAWLRLRYLPGILKRGRVPRGARAPGEVRPGDGPFDREAQLTALRDSAERFVARLEPAWERPGTVLTHHLFGSLSAAQAFRFVTVHSRHHRAQLPGSHS